MIRVLIVEDSPVVGHGHPNHDSTVRDPIEAVKLMSQVNVVRRVVARHGGRVRAEGKVDEGAAFYLSLPKGRQDGQI